MAYNESVYSSVVHTSSSERVPCANTACINVTEIDAVTISDDGIWAPDVIQRVTSLVFIMILTLIGNTVIIIVLTCSRYRQRYSRVNIFIINLAVGDLAVCFCTMTTEVLFVAFGQWVLGAVACKVLTYIQVITLASTTFILTAMSFDRYMAICKPLAYRATTTRAKNMIAIAWAFAFILAVPQNFIFIQIREARTNKLKCASAGYTAFWQRKLYFSFMTAYILVVPAMLISYCYINVLLVVWRQSADVAASKDHQCTLRRSRADKRAIPRAKIKTVKMTLSIIVSFIACYTPYFVTTLIRVYSEYRYHVPKSVMAFVETLALLQSAINPLLYGIFNIKIQRELMEVFCPRQADSATSGKSNGGTECLSVTSYPVVRYRDAASTSSSSSQDRMKGVILKEENQNGFKLRVRFATKETYFNERHCSEGDDNNASMLMKTTRM